VDVTVYVSGQRVRCSGCGINFEVRRSDATMVGTRQAVGASTTRAAEAATRIPGATAAPVAFPVEVESTQLRVLQGGEQGSGQGAEQAGRPAVNPDLNVTAIRPAQAEIPGYELLEVLGRGGMGEVWRAKQKSLARMVAIKLLPDKLSKNPEFIARFQKEATALAALSHPNITQIIDRGVADEQYYFVMEFVQGQSLRDLMSHGKMSPEGALRLISQICRAIDYAHAQGIIHRDLKPENILVDELGNVKVADFGLAGIQAGSADLHLTATSVAMGTVNYMAPEQRRDAKNVDGRADLYSLGVIFYEMLTGELPLGRFKLPSERVPGLDARLDPIVAQALESEPNARPGRASEIDARLAPLLSELGSGIRPKSASSLPAASRNETAGSNVTTSPLGHASRGWRIGAVAIAVLGAIFLFMRLTGREVHVQKRDSDRAGGAGLSHSHRGRDLKPRAPPPNTEGELSAQSRWTESKSAVQLAVRFLPASSAGPAEELHAHAGAWWLEGGKLKATQVGELTSSGILIPRAYVDDRFFSSDDFDAQVRMELAPLERDYALKDDAPVFAELGFQLDDVQLSIFADPSKGMRLTWRYQGTRPVAGSTDRDIQIHAADEAFVPNGRSFVVRLKLHRDDDATTVTAYLDGQAFAAKSLRGLTGQLGKVALGCRNLHCTFDQLTVRGAPLNASQRAEAARERAQQDHGER